MEEKQGGKVNKLESNFEELKEYITTKENGPLNSSIIICEEEDLSTMSEIVVENDILEHPNENFDWKTPAGLHRSLNDLSPTPGSAPSAPPPPPPVINRYRLDYTASPADDRHISSESEKLITENQSFLEMRQQEHYNS